VDRGDDYDQITIEVARHNPKLLVSSWRERYFTSDDGGETWKETNFNSIDPLGYGVLPPHPKDFNVSYRLVEFQNAPGKYHLERSSNRGRTWIEQKCLLKGTNSSINVSNVLYHPRDSATIYTYGSIRDAGPALNGFFLSHDGGQTFSFILSTYSARLAISASNPEVIYTTGTNQSVIKSMDGGSTWNLVGQESEIRSLGRQSNHLNIIYDIIVDPSDSNLAYLVSTKGIIRTTDGGSTWCNMNLGEKISTSIGTMALSPLNRKIMLVGTARGLYRSRSGGCDWERISILDRLVK
jgi:hypothetical protein